jgi:hypothetical protein
MRGVGAWGSIGLGYDDDVAYLLDRVGETAVTEVRWWVVRCLRDEGKEGKENDEGGEGVHVDVVPVGVGQVKMK